LDFEDLVAPEVQEYSIAHLQLYRWWLRACGNSRDSLGQAQVQRMLERNGLVGDSTLFADRVSTQLWLSRAWRELAPGNYGLNLPQFVSLASRLGLMLEGGNTGNGGAASTSNGSDSEDSLPPRPNHLSGVLTFYRRGLATL